MKSRLIALALAAGLSCPACYHASGALEVSLIGVSQRDTQPAAEYPLKLAMVASATDGIRWEGCGTTDDICTLALEPTLHDELRTLLRAYFEQVDFADSLDAANRDGELVAIESVVTFPAQGRFAGFIRITLVFKDPDTGRIVAEPSAVEKIKITPVMESPPEIGLVVLDVATADLFLPLHAYIANLDGMDSLSQAAVPALISALQSLGQQIAADPQLAAYAASRPSRETVEADPQKQTASR